MPMTNRRVTPIARTSVAIAVALITASAARPAPEPTDDSEAARVALAAVGKQLGVDPEKLQVAAVATAYYPNLDWAVQSFKIADPKGLLHPIAVDAKLRPVDPEALADAESEERRRRFGALDPALAERIERGGDEWIPVTLWVRDTTKRRWDRPTAQGEPLDPKAIDEIYASVAEERAAALRSLVAPVVERVRAFDPKASANELAPVIGATLSVEALRELARDSDIDAIYQDILPQPELDIVKATTGIATVHLSGTLGRGVRVADIQGMGGEVEANSLLLRPVSQDLVGLCPGVDHHATGVAGIMVERRFALFGTPVGEEGTSPNIELRSGGSCSIFTPELQAASTRGVRWGARILNLTWGMDTRSALGGMDRFYDEIVLNQWRTVTKSAGNATPGGPNCFQSPGDGTITSPGGAYNIITVGGFDDRNTVTWTDDTIYECSSTLDPISLHGDREKPDLAAPAVNINVVAPGPANLLNVTGTSAAAPVVAGTSALLIERNSRLSIWPEIIRATLMATADHNIEGSTRLSDVDGAGGLNASAAASLIDMPQRWGGQRYTCNGTDPLNLVTLSVGPRTRHRVVLSWDADPAFAGYATRPAADIDLRVRDANGISVAASLSFDGVNEIVEFDSWLAGTYTVQAIRFRCDLPTWLGWAWHTLPMPRPAGSK
jgi:subtilisin family serine protease